MAMIHGTEFSRECSDSCPPFARVEPLKSRSARPHRGSPRRADYGYARVSTDGQSVDAQVAALTAAGAEKVFREVASGPRPTGCNSAGCSTSSTPATC
jgi:Resolvase, N terminal domain